MKNAKEDSSGHAREDGHPEATQLPNVDMNRPVSLDCSAHFVSRFRGNDALVREPSDKRTREGEARSADSSAEALAKVEAFREGELPKPEPP